MTKVKICGITNLKEISLLNKYLPDYAGFVFVKSRRQVTPEQAAELGAGLAPTIKKVGVFVDYEVELVADAAMRAGLDAVQLHGSENGRYIEVLRSLLKPGIEIWKALRVNDDHMPEPGMVNSMDVDRLLLDTYINDAYGGTGKCFEWGLVTKMSIDVPIVLAGGLNPGNVRQAMEQAKPFAVDISSGVESEGFKDEHKMQAFIDTVRGGKV